MKQDSKTASGAVQTPEIKQLEYESRTADTPPVEEELEIDMANLGAVTADEVESVVVITKDGESRLMSVAEARKFLAVNPSTTEQATGETWDGKPVYAKYVEMEAGYNLTGSRHTAVWAYITTNVDRLLSITGALKGDSTSVSALSIISHNPGTEFEVHKYDDGTINAWYRRSIAPSSGQRASINVTLKYTKL